MLARNNSPGRNGREAAFSLLEVVAVILVLGILGLAAYPRLLSTGQFTAGLAAEMAATEIRAAQGRALFSGVPQTISFSGNTFTVDGRTGNLPGNAGAEERTISFNRFGEPTSGADEPFVVSSGGDTRTVTVTPLTGKVTIN